MLARSYAGWGLEAKERNFVCRQHAKEDLAEDLLRPDTAKVTAAAVYGSFTVITQNEHLLQRNLKRKLQIAKPEGFRLQIGLFQGFAVDGDNSVLTDVNRVPSKGNDTLDDQLVVVVKGTDFSGFKLGSLVGDENFTGVEVRLHGGARHPEHRQEDDRHQNRKSRNHYNSAYGALQRLVETPLGFDALHLLLHFIR